MGVEHPVTRWYVQRQLLIDEIAKLEAWLAEAQADAREANNDVQHTEIEEQLAAAQARLRTLGPCPKPMMG